MVHASTPRPFAMLNESVVIARGVIALGGTVLGLIALGVIALGRVIIMMILSEADSVG